MIKNLLKYITVIGLAYVLFSCEKDEVKVYMLDNPIPPTIVSFPDLTLQISKATDTLVFVGTPVDPGFQASVKYYLEACATGTNFAKPLTVFTGIYDEVFKTTVGDLDKLMVKKFKAGQVVVDFRIRAVLVVDAGTGALGTSTNPLAFNSETKTVSVTIY
jgi:starch-binding outer membrane protein SusE/F